MLPAAQPPFVVRDSDLMNKGLRYLCKEAGQKESQAGADLGK